MLTKETASDAREFHAEGSCHLRITKTGRPVFSTERWRRNGKTKTWVTQPERYEIPIKHGMYDHGYIRNGDEDLWHIPGDCEAWKQLLRMDGGKVSV